LDESNLEELRRWGQALRDGDSERSAAAGRAILMLIEEIERMRLELLRAERLGADTLANEVDAAQVGAALHRRLHGVPDRDSDRSLAARPESVREAGPAEGGAESTSAHSWIEALRRHK
jgi:hypothetical protein